MIDDIARENPGRTWASVPYDDSDLARGYEDISYAQLAAAIDRLAWMITLAVGTSAAFETIAYFGEPDLRYPMMQMAACKTGHKVMFSSALNTEDTHVALLGQLQCKAIFSASAINVDGVLARWPVGQTLLPDLDDLLRESEGTEKFPYTKTFEEAQSDPYLVLHTSGTTGMPRPVAMNHAMQAAVDAQALLPSTEGRERFLVHVNAPNRRFLIPSPPSHVMGAVLCFIVTVFGGGIFVPGFRHRQAEIQDICPILDHANIDVGILAPWIMEDLARRPGGEQYMRGFEHALFGGASISPSAAEKWAKYTRVQNLWGSTEALLLPYLQAEKDEHDYVVFDMVHSGVYFRPVDADSQDADGNSVPLYRAILTMGPESEATAVWHKAHGFNLASGPPYPEFDTGDLWTPHPDPERAHFVWKFAGRADDLLTFATGNNLHRADMERALSDHPAVEAALVVGAGHCQAVLLIEPAAGASEEDAAELWDAVVAPVNRRVPLQGTVARTHVVIVPHRGFVRTPKGSVVRKATEERYSQEIETVYEVHGDAPPFAR
ncbi:acetyl-CoA synthetase-like protein [Thozetella sp. PMI_491]|nr:acetyl-CoA synthetase-like protein [Thozetella sp. PMI_491]